MSRPDPRPAAAAPAPLAFPDGALAADLLHGAEAIAAFLFGDTNQRRRVYHLVQTCRLPVFRMGVTLCARKSRLLAWVEAQETQALRGTDRPT